MTSAVVDIIAPKTLVLPRNESELQQISGALWISGANLIYWPSDGTDSEYVITATQNA